LEGYLVDPHGFAIAMCPCLGAPLNMIVWLTEMASVDHNWFVPSDLVDNSTSVAGISPSALALTTMRPVRSAPNRPDNTH